MPELYIEHDRGINLGFAGTQIVTNNNKKASTTYEWSEARNTISVLAELIKKSGGKVINPNPDAAKIEHVSYTPLVAIETTNDIIDNEESISLTHLLLIKWYAIAFIIYIESFLQSTQIRSREY